MVKMDQLGHPPKFRIYTASQYGLGPGPDRTDIHGRNPTTDGHGGNPQKVLVVKPCHKVFEGFQEAGDRGSKTGRRSPPGSLKQGIDVR